MRHILLVVPDLFFSTRIVETARLLGLETVNIAASDLLATCRERRPDLVVIDLSGPGDALAAVRALRAEPGLADLELVGFYPHVEDALRQGAIAAGMSRVMPRSAFTKRLPDLLAGATSG